MNYLASMLEQLKILDERLFLFLNQFHTPGLDPVIFLITKTEFWIPLFAYLLYLVFRMQGKNGWLAITCIVLTVVLADQITSGFMKPFFERLRPSHEPSLEGIIHLVNNYQGGRYGFVSGHAANTTAVSLFIYLLLRETHRFAWLIFLWAVVMSYTRIYLGVHYPGDVVVGMLVGLTCGYSCYGLYSLVRNKWQRKRGTLG